MSKRANDQGNLKTQASSDDVLDVTGTDCTGRVAADLVLQFGGGCTKMDLRFMTQPLALMLYEKLLPGSQLVNRLQDAGYRVQTVPGAASLVECAEKEKPMIVLADVAPASAMVVEAIGRLRQNAATSHIPVIAFAGEKEEELQTAARNAGATLVVNDAAILTHLTQFLEQALRVD